MPPRGGRFRRARYLPSTPPRAPVQESRNGTGRRDRRARQAGIPTLAAIGWEVANGNRSGGHSHPAGVLPHGCRDECYSKPVAEHCFSEEPSVERGIHLVRDEQGGCWDCIRIFTRPPE